MCLYGCSQLYYKDDIIVTNLSIVCDDIAYIAPVRREKLLGAAPIFCNSSTPTPPGKYCYPQLNRGLVINCILQ